MACRGSATEAGGRQWGSNVGDRAPVPLGGEGVVEKRPGGVRKLGAGSIGVGGDRKGRSHGEAEPAAVALRR
jgi:hypothetical protein